MENPSHFAVSQGTLHQGGTQANITNSTASLDDIQVCNFQTNEDLTLQVKTHVNQPQSEELIPVGFLCLYASYVCTCTYTGACEAVIGNAIKCNTHFKESVTVRVNKQNEGKQQ